MVDSNLIEQGAAVEDSVRASHRMVVGYSRAYDFYDTEYHHVIRLRWEIILPYVALSIDSCMTSCITPWRGRGTRVGGC